MSTFPNPITVVTPQYEVEVFTDKGLISLKNNIVLIETFTTCRDMAGGWRIQLVFRQDEDGVNNYELLNPMDYVRIKMSNKNDDDQKPITVMRGFVTHIENTFEIQDGTPVRIINVTGDNYAKLIKMCAIHYIMGLDPPSILAGAGSTLPLTIGWGVRVFNAHPSEVITDVFNQLIIPQFVNVQNSLQERHQNSTNNDQQLSQQVDAFALDIDNNGTDGARTPQGITSNGDYNFILCDPSAGTATTMVHDFMNEYACRPWNEIFVDDAPSRSWLVFRPFPYRDRDGNYVGYTAFGTTTSATGGGDSSSTNYVAPDQERADSMNPITITMEETVSHILRRSDEEVVNYLFTNAVFVGGGVDFEHTAYSQDQDNSNPHFTANFTQIPQGDTSAPPSPKKEYSQMELYGFREMRWPTRYISVNPTDLSAPEQFNKMYVNSANFLKMASQLTNIIFNGLEHVSQLESGEIIIRGREDIRPGMFIKFRYKRNDSNYYMYYVVDVAQSLIPFQSWLTRLTVIRGEGFLKPGSGKTPHVTHTINFDPQENS